MSNLLQRLGQIFNVKAKPQARLTDKERAKRKKKRKIAAASRKKNRQRKK
jgi:hypothetical protein